MALTPRSLLPAARGQRILTAATFVNTFGSGMFMASSALYFTRVVGLSMAAVALGLFTGAMIGLAAGVLAGRVADRWGARETQIAVMASGTVAMSCFLFTDTFWSYTLVCAITGVVYAADKASKAPLVRRLAGANPAGFRAYLRAVTNLAIALGALAAGVVIQLDSKPAYLVMIVGRAAAFLGSALALSRLPKQERTVSAPAAGGRWQVARDRPYVSATVLNCLMSLHFAVPGFLLPLWIVGHTDAPRWMVSCVLVVNTILVIALQVPISKGVGDADTAGRRMLWAGLALFAGLGLMASAGGTDPWTAATLLVLATAVYTLGELWHAAASMEWSFGLAAPDKQGEYAGFFGIGVGVAEALAPSVLGALALGWGVPGWFVLGAIFLTVGAVSRPLVAWAQRHSPPHAAEEVPVAVPVPSSS
ncbi:MFS transporter [Streptomyces sp. NPDC051956]|uniref:MFS transporter n=1 Tax=Streptomyces sp. NPDC051956 TaxID=3365677 RepID=UPI0037D61293